ncbi:ureidoglycolate lyase [Pseudacidovorax intermedius]|uniref:ureidoglycolate lyase n=1 Tax=Pseudacidovorax intermedius TaxID=433924 RepID=UPI00034AAC33|nr:ureidoglycolate lyase [Pseudacidovorax intermedius]
MTETVPPSTDARLVDLPVEPIRTDTFAPYGTLIESTYDGKPFGDDEAQLTLDRGTPRFYIMKLERREPVFRQITRHLAVTQCLASAGGRPWMIAVAPPDGPDDPAAPPDITRLRAFRVEGHQAIMLARGTWHAGPFFEDETVDFFNLELADTNLIDHHNCALDRRFGMRYRFVTG